MNEETQQKAAEARAARRAALGCVEIPGTPYRVRQTDERNWVGEVWTWGEAKPIVTPVRYSSGAVEAIRALVKHITEPGLCADVEEWASMLEVTRATIEGATLSALDKLATAQKALEDATADALAAGVVERAGGL